jgi:hypothetical protein
MLIFNRFWAIFRIAAKRILSQPGMAVATTLGMIFAISLTMSVPLYASSVYNAIFLQRIDDGPRGSRIEYPPFSFMFTYDSNVTGNLQWQDLAQINEYIAQQTGPMVGLPVKIYTAISPPTRWPFSLTRSRPSQITKNRSSGAAWHSWITSRSMSTSVRAGCPN